MSVITRILPDNPVLTKELRVRMRGSRAYWILFGYLGFLALVLLVQYAAWLSNVQFRGAGASEASRLGNDIFNMIMLTQVFLVLFITPAITSGALTIEREQQTMDLLTLTRIPRRSIIAGKLLSAAAFTALLLVSSLPLVSVCFMLGSVDPMMVVSYYTMMLFGSLMIGAMGLMWSSLARTTTQAVMFTYGSLFILFWLIMAMFAMNQNQFHSGSILENLFMAMSAPLFGTKFFRFTVFEGFGFAVFCLLLTFLMGAVAMSRLDLFPERKGGLLRGWAAAIFGLFVLMCNVWWVDAWYNRATQAVQMGIQPPCLSLIIPATLLMLLVPIYATGEWNDAERRSFVQSHLMGLRPAALKSGRMASGLLFLLCLCGVTFAMYALTFFLFGKPGEMFKPIGSYQTPSVVMGLGMPPALNSVQSTGSVWNIGAVMVASVIGFALLCQFFSTLFRNRWAGWLFGNVFLGMMFFLPLLGFANYGSMPDIRANFLIFNPTYVVSDMAHAFPNTNQLAWVGIFPSLATAAVVSWLVLGAVSLFMTRLLARNSVSVPKPKPDVVATVQA